MGMRLQTWSGIETAALAYIRTYLDHVQLGDAVLLQSQWKRDVVLLDQHACSLSEHKMRNESQGPASIACT